MNNHRESLNKAALNREDANEPLLRFELFGGLRAFDLNSNQLIPVIGHKKRCLLAYLLLSGGRDVSREQLSTALWPDFESAQSRTNLRRELHNLRKTHRLIDANIQSNKNTIVWSPKFQIETDVDTFLSGIKSFQSETASEQTLIAGRVAADCYSAELLSNMDDVWIEPLRDNLRRQWVTLCEQLIPMLERSGDLTYAIDLARRLVDVDPYRESSVQVLMHLYEKSGNRGLALHAYHTCASLLASDLGIEPGEQLRQIKSILLSRTGQTSEPARIDRHMVGHRKRPLIGRDQELLQIEAQRQTARDGKPMLVLITGEAGIGKTTLLNRFTEGQESSAMPALVARCFSGEGELPYSPIVNWLQNIDCESLLPLMPPAFRFELILAFPELIQRSIDVPNIYAHPPNRSRGRLFEAIAKLFETVNRPITLALDDIQWVDKDTMEWIRFLFRSRPTMPILVLASLRNGEIDNLHPIHALTSTLAQASQLHEIPLKPLQEQEIRELIEIEARQSAEHSGIPDTENTANRRNALVSVASRLSGGNPLFALEIARHQINAIDVDPLEDGLASVPPVIQSVLEAQLNLLSATAKSLADITAVAGRHITPELIEKVGATPDEDYVGALEELWDRQILREAPNGSYSFRHELIREVCYALLSPPRRSSLHARIAAALSSTMRAKGGAEAGQIAMHYRLAGQIEDAYQWSCEAAAHAENSLAVRDAITFLDRALSCLDQLDPDRSRVTDRVRNLLAMSKLIALVEGFSAPRVVSLCGTITSLLPKVQDAGLKQQVMLRLRQLYSFGGFPRRALRLTNELIDHSMRGEDPLQQVEAYRLRSITQIQIGQFGPACESMKMASKIAEAAIKTGTVPLINTPFSIPMLHTIWAMVATVMGQANLSDVHLVKARQFTIAKTDTFSNSLLLLATANAYQQLNRPQEVMSLGEQLSAMAQESHLPKVKCVGDYFQGWAMARLGSTEEGVARIIEAFDRFPPNADHHLFPFWYAHLAELQVGMNQPNQALNSARLGIQSTRQTRETLWCAELFRVQGLAMASCDFEESQVAESFRVAFEIGKRQQAKLFQLRTLNDKLCHAVNVNQPIGGLSKSLSRLLDEVLPHGQSDETRRAEALLAANS